MDKTIAKLNFETSTGEWVIVTATHIVSAARRIDAVAELCRQLNTTVDHVIILE